MGNGVRVGRSLTAITASLFLSAATALADAPAGGSNNANPPATPANNPNPATASANNQTPPPNPTPSCLDPTNPVQQPDLDWPNNWLTSWYPSISKISYCPTSALANYYPTYADVKPILDQAHQDGTDQTKLKSDLGQLYALERTQCLTATRADRQTEMAVGLTVVAFFGLATAGAAVASALGAATVATAVTSGASGFTAISKAISTDWDPDIGGANDAMEKEYERLAGLNTTQNPKQASSDTSNSESPTAGPSLGGAGHAESTGSGAAAAVASLAEAAAGGAVAQQNAHGGPAAAGNGGNTQSTPTGTPDSNQTTAQTTTLSGAMFPQYELDLAATCRAYFDGGKKNDQSDQTDQSKKKPTTPHSGDGRSGKGGSP